MEEKKLTRAQWDQLRDQYERTPDPDEGSSASGEHYMLAYILGRLGYHSLSRREAMKIAERLLSNGWEDE